VRGLPLPSLAFYSITISVRRISVFERSGRTGPEDQDYSPIYVGDVTERSVAGGEEFREEQHQQRMLRHVFRLLDFF